MNDDQWAAAKLRDLLKRVSAAIELEAAELWALAEVLRRAG